MDSASTQNHRSARPRRAVSAPKRGAERLRLDAEIAALRDTIVNDEEFRQAAIRVLAGALEEGRAEARRQLEDGGKGLACAARISHLEDEIIGAVHGLALRFLRLGESAPAAARLTVAAVGGYGRGLLAPGSDIDLLVPAARRAHAGGREDRRDHALCALGSASESRPRHAIDRRMPAAGQGRHDDPHHAARSAVHPGRAGAVRQLMGAFRQGDRRALGARVRRGQARRTRQPPEADGGFTLCGRAQRQGGQGRPARSQHAVLGRQIRLSGARHP